MPSPEIPPIQERPEEIKVPENLRDEVRVVEETPKTNISVNPKGEPVITNSPPKETKIELPDEKTLWQKAKRTIKDAATWLARFILRQLDIKRIKEGEDQNASGSDTNNQS